MQGMAGMHTWCIWLHLLYHRHTLHTNWWYASATLLNIIKLFVIKQQPFDSLNELETHTLMPLLVLLLFHHNFFQSI